MERFDVLVVGAGHAGVEAALAAARLGASTGLITIRRDAVARMSCNPAIGGLAKGTLVREVDALGGEMGLAADANGIQFRMLNTSRGPAVRGPRAQQDLEGYSLGMGRVIATQENLTLIEGEVVRVLAQDGRVTGVGLGNGDALHAPDVVLAPGTFMEGEIHLGPERTRAGRLGEPASIGLSASLRELGLRVARLKTGTPPRLDGSTIAYDGLQRQEGDAVPSPFSYLTSAIDPAGQVPCWMAWTNETMHRLVRDNIDDAPLFSGQIRSTGPRYCPSFETKVVRFPEKDRHLLFLEPEQRQGRTIYLNGLSTSLPRPLQEALVRSIPGLEKARLLRYGYAIEYDFVPCLGQITPDLQCRAVRGLYLAGQINGTSGYEEAAVQGLLAGVNAVLARRGESPLILRRDQALSGVLVDDMVTRDLREPYRMFTSRAEYRLLLRQDNADRRLTRLGHRIGLAGADRLARLEAHERRIREARELLSEARQGAKTLEEILRRPEITWESLAEEDHRLAALALPDRAAEQVEIEVKYAGYIARQERTISKHARLEAKPLPVDLDYFSVTGLSSEAAEKLDRARPLTLGQAGRLEGVTPADVSVLTVHLKAGKG